MKTQKPYVNTGCVTIRDLAIQNLAGITDSYLGYESIKVTIDTDSTATSGGINTTCQPMFVNQVFSKIILDAIPCFRYTTLTLKLIKDLQEDKYAMIKIRCNDLKDGTY